MGTNEARCRRRRLHVHARARGRSRPPRRHPARRGTGPGRPRRTPARPGRAVSARIMARLRPCRDRALAPPTSTTASTGPARCCCSCASAARPPGTGTRPGRCPAAASARKPPARAGSPKRCAPCRSCWTSPNGPANSPRRARGSSTSPTRSASSPAPCSTPGTARSACATSPSASSAASPRCSASTRSPDQLGHVGLNHLTWERGGAARRRRRAAARCSPSTARTSRSDIGLPASVIRVTRCRPVLLPALLLRRTTRRGGAARRPTRAEVGRRLSRTNCSTCTPTRSWTTSRTCSASAAARSTPRRRSRCSPRWSRDTGDVQVVNVRNNGTLPLPGRRRGHRGAGR